MLNGKVLQTASVGDITVPKLAEQQKGPPIPVAETEIQALPAMGTGDVINGLEDAGAVVFLFPPKFQLKWSIPRLWRALKLFILNNLKPAYDTGCKESRVNQLLTANKKCFKILQTQYSREKLWYLEVIAVHPSLQSRGIGGKVMCWILEHIQDQPIYLECTRRENIGFYESFGFEVVDEVELVDDEQKLSYWVMVRPGKRDI
ncbi:Acyl-CoA N-acyltransferase [Penicillium malachiteum]|uniref:Acyl-CoA N-acyltransferase n=1 Tax=Penicillium malachiteum TaxID=1324776 RepID=UPI00254787DA|nr:Acyl-CoA N-acyltransferase [Penicillium malachiteum]KAJ5731334.1 Acyl-CoA N-acyltransferase [Penicillium malachiteum]